MMEFLFVLLLLVGIFVVSFMVGVEFALWLDR